MPKFVCICKTVIDLSPIPAPDQWMIISDNEMTNVFEKEEKDEIIDVSYIYQQMKIVIKCPNCGRLHIFWDGFEKSPIIYKIDDTFTIV